MNKILTALIVAVALAFPAASRAQSQFQLSSTTQIYTNLTVPAGTATNGFATISVPFNLATAVTNITVAYTNTTLVMTNVQTGTWNTNNVVLPYYLTNVTTTLGTRQVYAIRLTNTGTQNALYKWGAAVANNTNGVTPTAWTPLITNATVIYQNVMPIGTLNFISNNSTSLTGVVQAEILCQ